MKSVNELLRLFMRQAELERAMRQPGGARVTQERELQVVRRRLAEFPEDMRRSNATADPLKVAAEAAPQA